MFIAFLIGSLLLGGVVAWFASDLPDGLEWSMAGVAGSEELTADGAVHRALTKLQESVSLLPDYGWAGEESGRLGTSVAGVVGIIVVLLAGIGLGKLLIRRPRATVNGS